LRAFLPENAGERGIGRLGVLVTALALSSAAATIAQEEPGPYERYLRGIAALEAKDARKAVPDLEAAASFFGRDPDALLALAKAALTGDVEGALATPSRAARGDPRRVRVRVRDILRRSRPLALSGFVRRIPNGCSEKA
jgi:hypothetical protein